MIKPQRMYLDQNLMINLHGAVKGNPNFEHLKPLAEKLFGLQQECKISVPLSWPHTVETHKIKDLIRRQSLKDFMFKLSFSDVIVPVEEYESANILSKLLRRSQPYRDFEPLVFPHFKNQPKHAINPSTLNDGAKIFLYFLPNSLKSMMLEEVPNARLIPQITDEYVTKVLDIASTAADRVYERFQIHKEQTNSPTELKQRTQELLFSEFLSNYQTLTKSKDIKEARRRLKRLQKRNVLQLEELISHAPSLDTMTELVFTRLNSSCFQRNDFFDIYTLSTAIPYCDIVVTERAFGNIARTQGLDEKYNTKIFTTKKSELEEFSEFVEQI